MLYNDRKDIDKPAELIFKRINLNMKLINLNIWGGKIFKPLLSFLESNSDVDIFCFQEVFNEGHSIRPVTKSWRMDIFKKISETLSGHEGFFCYEQKNEEGIAMFIKKDLIIRNKGWIFVHKWENEIEADGGPLSRVLQWARIKKDNKEYIVSHFHGLWHKSGKDDTPERIKQSEKVKTFLDSFPDHKIICGDLNLNPKTKSLEILKKGMRELVTENNIQSTRSSLYLKESKHADYMLVSKDIEVKEFKLLPNIVSDHLPLYLEFN